VSTAASAEVLLLVVAEGAVAPSAAAAAPVSSGDSSAGAAASSASAARRLDGSASPDAVAWHLHGVGSRVGIGRFKRRAGGRTVVGGWRWRQCPREPQTPCVRHLPLANPLLLSVGCAPKGCTLQARRATTQAAMSKGWAQPGVSGSRSQPNNSTNSKMGPLEARDPVSAGCGFLARAILGCLAAQPFSIRHGWLLDAQGSAPDRLEEWSAAI
jgi:hypothetical protein